MNRLADDTTSHVPRQLVVAAQRGDQHALHQLVSACLPLVYGLAGRALDESADVDDAVQETMFLLVRDLASLRDPARFRGWLTAIALHQIDNQRRVRDRAARRAAPYDEVLGAPDPDSDHVGITILRLGLSGQRRQIVEATHWLDPAHRDLLALWWLEAAGQLSRADIAEAAGEPVTHTTVRIHRMREQLEQARTLVAALETRPRCPRLDDALLGWDGIPTSVWRKRLARHVRECHTCAGRAAGLVPPDRLLASIALAPVPATLVAALLARNLLTSASSMTTAGHASAVFSGSAPARPHSGGGGLTTAANGKAVLASLAAVTVIAGIAVTVATRPETPAPRIVAPVIAASPAAAVPAPSASASVRPKPTPTSVLGRHSLRLADERDLYVHTVNGRATTVRLTATSSPAARRKATFDVVRGLADRDCVSFRAADGQYLRHYAFHLRLDSREDTRLFREDATFCLEKGAVTGSYRLRSYNRRTRDVHVRESELGIDVREPGAEFGAKSSFLLSAPL